MAASQNWSRKSPGVHLLQPYVGLLLLQHHQEGSLPLAPPGKPPQCLESAHYYWWDQSDLWPFFLKNGSDIFKGSFKTVVTTNKRNILLRLYTGPEALPFSPLQKKFANLWLRGMRLGSVYSLPEQSWGHIFEIQPVHFKRQRRTWEEGCSGHWLDL